MMRCGLRTVTVLPTRAILFQGIWALEKHRLPRSAVVTAIRDATRTGEARSICSLGRLARHGDFQRNQSQIRHQRSISCQDPVPQPEKLGNRRFCWKNGAPWRTGGGRSVLVSDVAFEIGGCDAIQELPELLHFLVVDGLVGNQRPGRHLFGDVDIRPAAQS